MPQGIEMSKEKASGNRNVQRKMNLLILYYVEKTDPAFLSKFSWLLVFVSAESCDIIPVFFQRVFLDELP